jgi:hypothetical protein
VTVQQKTLVVAVLVIALVVALAINNFLTSL